MNKRIERIREEIRKEVSKIILYEIKDPRLKGMPSVVNVKVTNDMSYATIYVSILGSKEEKEESHKALISAAGYVRRQLARRLRLRHIPIIKFEIDDFIEKGIKINEILNNLK